MEQMLICCTQGGMIGGFFATNIGSTMPFGMDGWRFAFHLMALVSLVTSGLVFYIATDPRPTAKVYVVTSRWNTYNTRDDT